MADSKGNLYSEFLNFDKEQIASRYSRVHVILHGLVLLSVLAIYHVYNLEMILNNNAFFISSIIWSFFAYGAWYMLSMIDEYSSIIVFQLFDTERIILERLANPVEANKSIEQIQKLDIRAELWPVNLLPMDDLFIRKYEMTAEVARSGNKRKLVVLAFYFGIMLSFLFNMFGASLTFIDPIIITGREAYQLVLWSLFPCLIFLIITFIITRNAVNIKK